MKKTILSMALCSIVASGCATTYRAERYPVPPELPPAALPVWLMYHAFETNDFDLFERTLSKGTREYMQARSSLSEAFEAGRRSATIPLANLRFTVSDRDDQRFPNAVLKSNYRFVFMWHERFSAGTITKLEGATWKVAHPTTEDMADMVSTMQASAPTEP